jgi:hypothetical protein
MDDAGRKFIPLDDSQTRELLRTGSAGKARQPIFTVGEFIELRGIRMEVIRVATIPPRLVLKPCGRLAGEG